MAGAGAAAQGLPGGASSLNEKHGDWTVACAMQADAVRCGMTQTQMRGENRQRVLTIELQAPNGDNTANGTLVLPFGLQLDSGVVLSIDENEFLPALRFSTCLPVGCVVPLTFNADAISALRAGGKLAVKAAANESGQEVNLSISLLGFGSALDRITQLVGS
jgi:invasion protein IalB